MESSFKPELRSCLIALQKSMDVGYISQETFTRLEEKLSNLRFPDREKVVEVIAVTLGHSRFQINAIDFGDADYWLDKIVEILKKDNMTKDEANQLIEKEKAAFIGASRNFSSQYEAKKDDPAAVTMLVGALITTHTALLNAVNKVIPDLHDTYNLFADKNLQVDLKNTVNNFLHTSLNYCDTLKRIETATASSASLPSPAAYHTIQSFLATFASQTEIEAHKSQFQQRNISTFGFDQKMEIPMTESKRNAHKWTSIIIGAIAVLLVIATLLLRDNLSTDLRIYLRILFALGIGGLSAALIGSITLNTTSPYQIMAAGGFAVFLIVYLIDPPLPGGSDFDTMVQLRSKSGKLISGSDIGIKMDIEGKSKEGQLIPASEGYEFADLSENLKNDIVEVYITSQQWQLDNGKASLKIKLVPGKIEVSVVRDTLSLMAIGRAMYEGTPLVGARVTALDFSDLDTITNDRGNFSLRLPDSHTGVSTRVQIQKDTISFEADLRLGRRQDISIPKKS